MKKLFVSTLLFINLVSCTTNKTQSTKSIDSDKTELIKISKKINDNSDDIMIAMQHYHLSIDSLSSTNNLTYDNVNNISEKTSAVMVKLLKTSDSLNLELINLPTSVKRYSEYTMCRRLMIRIQTSGSSFLTLETIKSIYDK